MSSTHGWYAWYNRMPGAANNVLRVTGVFEAPGGGYTAELEPGNIGIVPEPGLLALDLKITAPSAGTTALTSVPVYWQDDTAGDIRNVRIHTPDGPTYVAVEEVH